MKNKSLPRNLTYEQFRALAGQKPDMDAACVYQLECYEIADNAKPLYPKFELIHESYKLLFHTFEEAETYMHRLISGDVEEHFPVIKENVYCFHITRILLGRPVYENDATWLYDSNGKLLDYQYLPGAEDGREGRSYYYGRPKERIRFQKGDIVEINGGNEVYLAVVVSTEPDVDWCWRYYNRCMADKEFPYYNLDGSDFSAIVVTGPDYSYHEHVNPLTMMKPRFPIPDDLREYFRKCCFEAKECGEYSYEQPMKHPEMGYDVVYEFCGLDLYIHHDKDTEFPHLHISGFGHTFLVGLRLDCPEYYPHEGCFNDELTDWQKQRLMKELTEVEYGRTRWWHILRKWNAWHDDEPELQLPLDTPLPDYTRLT